MKRRTLLTSIPALGIFALPRVLTGKTQEPDGHPAAAGNEEKPKEPDGHPAAAGNEEPNPRVPSEHFVRSIYGEITKQVEQQIGGARVSAILRHFTDKTRILTTPSSLRRTTIYHHRDVQSLNLNIHIRWDRPGLPCSDVIYRTMIIDIVWELSGAKIHISGPGGWRSFMAKLPDDQSEVVECILDHCLIPPDTVAKVKKHNEHKV